jgi:hypothetical protein
LIGFLTGKVEGRFNEFEIEAAAFDDLKNHN